MGRSRMALFHLRDMPQHLFLHIMVLITIESIDQLLYAIVVLVADSSISHTPLCYHFIDFTP